MNANIRLDGIDKVKNFVNTISNINADFDIASGRYIIDAKSIMGLFSLNLCDDLRLSVRAKDGVTDEDILSAIRPYIV